MTISRAGGKSLTASARYGCYAGCGPHVVESFAFEETADGTRLSYSGELGTDIWRFGQAWSACRPQLGGCGRRLHGHDQDQERTPCTRRVTPPASEAIRSCTLSDGAATSPSDSLR
jgi:hypothetical protein